MDWLGSNLVWIIPTIWGAVEGWRAKKGSTAEKAYRAGEIAYEIAKQRQFAGAMEAVERGAEDLKLMIPEWQAKLDEADDKLRSLRPRRGSGLKAK